MPEGSRKIGAEVFVQATQARDELKNVQSDIRGVGAAAQEGSSKASAAMNGMASSANAHAAATGKARDELGRFTAHSDRASDSARSNAAALNLDAIAAAALAAALGAAIEKVIQTGIAFDAMKEQSQIAFTNLLHSEGQAKALLKELTDFAAETPFELSGLIPASQKLLAMGFTAKEIIPTLRAVGDAVAAMGGKAETVDRVTTALVQMRAKGKVSAEEMMQLAEAGIPAWQILADKLGITIPEAMKKAEKGAIDANTAIGALVEGMEKRFGGMMEQQSRTFNGLMSTLKDTSEQLAGEIAEPIFEATRDQLTRIIAGLPEFQRQFVGFWREIVKEAGNELSQLKPTVAAAIDDVKTLWATRHNEITNVTRTAWFLIYTGFIKPTVEGISRLISFASAAFAGDWEKAMNRLVAGTELAESRVMGTIGRWVQALFRVNGLISGIGPLLEMASRNQPAQTRFDPGGFHQHKHFEDTAEYAEKAAKAVANLNTKHKEGAAAAREHERAENQLTKQIREAQAALISDNFAARDAKINAGIAAEEAAYLLNRKRKELTAAEEAQFNALSLARHEKVLQDKFAAEQRFQDELRHLQINGITDAYDRERAQITFQLEKKAESLIKEFGLSRETTDKILAYKRATEDEFARWFIERQVQLNAELDRIAQQHDQKENAQIAQGSGSSLTRQIEEFKKQEAAIDSIIDKFQSRGGAAVQLFDMNQLDHAATLMRQYGLTVEDVDKAFGSASLSVEQFNERVDILTGSNLSAIDTLSQMVDWSQVLTAGIHAFTDAIAGAVAGTDNLGRALLASFFKIIGEIAITLGTLFLLAAAGFLVLPGFQWSAGQLAAAGTALLAFGAVMAGVGQRIAQGNQQHNAAGGASGGASGGSNAATGGAAPLRQQPAPIIIDLSSSTRQSQRPMQVTLQLDRNLSNDLIQGKKLLTAGNIKDQHYKAVKRVVRKMN